MLQIPEPWTPVEGGCNCGKVRYRIESLFLGTTACHCTYCQREMGSVHATHIFIETETVKLTAGQDGLIHVEAPTVSGSGKSMYASGANMVHIVR